MRQKAERDGKNSTAPVIALKNVVKRYGRRSVLDRLCLEVEEGEFVVILGGSGSGKSVMFRTMLGLETPDDGEVLVLGENLNRLDRDGKIDLGKRFGVVFQGGSLFNSMSVYENTAFPLDEDCQDEEGRVVRNLKQCNFDPEKMRQYPRELSGGLKQRAALARALVREPELMFLDEPTAGLDPATAEDISELIRERHESQSTKASVLITHDMRCAAIVADRIVYLDPEKRKTVELISADEMAYIRRTWGNQWREIEQEISSRIPEGKSPAKVAGTVSNKKNKGLESAREMFVNIGALFLCLGNVRAKCSLSDFGKRLIDIVARSCPLLLTSGFLVGLAVLLSSMQGLEMYGAESDAPQILGLSIVREIGPLLAGLLLAGRLGAAISAEFGLRAAENEYAALYTMGKDPNELHFTPLFIATVIGFPVLLFLTDAAAYFGGLVGYVGVYGFSDVAYQTRFFELLNPLDAFFTAIKGFVFGHIVLSTAYRLGLCVRPPEFTIERQVTQTVVTASLWIIVSNFLIMRVFDLLS